MEGDLKPTGKMSVLLSKKHIHLVLLTVLLIFGGIFSNTIAQINITQSQFESIFIPGKTHLFTNSDSTLKTVDIGKTGGPNIYDFTNIQLPPLDVSNNYYISSLPKLISKFPLDAITIGVTPDSIENNPVFLFKQDSVFVLGQASVIPQLEFKHYVPYQLLGLFPLSYGNTFSQTLAFYDTTFNSSGGIISNYSDTEHNITTIDGFGTLKIFGHQVECLRIKLDHTNQGDKEFIYMTREGIFLDIMIPSTEADTGLVQVYGAMVLIASPLTGTKENIINIPTEYSISQNFPNPFNPSTTITYQLPKDGIVTIKVFSVSGKEVSTLVNQYKPAGRYTINFSNIGLSSGVYLYQIKVNDFISVKKMVLLK